MPLVPKQVDHDRSNRRLDGETKQILRAEQADCSHGIEVKHGGLKYLKWSVAWHLLMTKYPGATYYYDDPITLPDGTMLVRTGVTVDGTTLTMQLPVLDHRNKPLSNPNSFDYNTAAQRCLTKNIAMFGVGIDLYHGDSINITDASMYEKASELIDVNDYMGLHKYVKGLSEADQIDLYNSAPPGSKVKFKEAHKAAMKQAEEFLTSVAEAIEEAVAKEDGVLLAETIDELSTYERAATWSRLDGPTQSAVKELRTQQGVSA